MNAMVKHEPQDFMVLNVTNEEKVKRALSANIGNSRLGRFELPRIKTPSGGGLTWEIPSIKGDISAKELVGIIVHWADYQSFWAIDFDETGGEPPDCSSDDGLNGRGNPGGECAICPNNQWGSAGKGAGKACRIQRVLYFLMPRSILPMIYQVPPTGYTIIKNFFNGLASEAIPFYGAVVSFALEKNKSKANKDGKGGNISYSRIVPKILNELSEEQILKMEAYRKNLQMVNHGIDE